MDVSGDENLRIVADDVSVSPVKAVNGLREVARQRYARNLLTDKGHQGVVANRLSLEGTSKDMARLVSCRTPLSFRDLGYLHRARLDILPLRGHSWFSSQEQDTSCRRCGKENETRYHVLNHCEEVKQGLEATVNKAILRQRLRPDVEFLLSGSRVMVDVVVCYDQPGSMENAYQRKIEKYSSLGRILPLVFGSLGLWNPRNEDIRSILGIDGRTWVCVHFHHGATNPEDEDIHFSHLESPLPVD
ncbi:hypothetical protein GHT06_018502 [Daphnia sinensis]|uniref:Uncharacterized protein n=1 Tax=Daphnia sinensis TaxID=1820382 RepID=A0AAD5KML3_9CRUS|nr:hypothetical protein GHT06_018502 [Daphnia sinensis]